MRDLPPTSARKILFSERAGERISKRSCQKITMPQNQREQHANANDQAPHDSSSKADKRASTAPYAGAGLVLDVASGSAFQNQRLSEEAFRGELYADHEHSLQGNHDILNITEPKIAAEVHDDCLETGCDTISTNTFNATSIAQEDFATHDICFELN